ncbi:auxin response factor 3-like isoform X2 [Andrographis paniculata]|uniref:auxin response factor 3-like isoform X2 n=1 Tax=Andrographis paniculata TaxID=175694 RepID=UPI0021E7C62E|nr:auxin response factor 3-like isoform X2 [Andrographis paniculata]
MTSGLIDLNTVENEEETPSPSGSPSSTAVYGNLQASSSTAVSMELWHACAGPLISLPKKGSAVVYCPQGHLEQLPEHPPIVYDLPPHVFCRVIDVNLHADAANDEVYAQVSLIPDQQIEQRWREGVIEVEDDSEDTEAIEKPLTQHMFCKTLTASDTSTHGGFSVPRRAAEDCFPPLDYKQQRPSQELVAADLHGSKWKFRHIYRGQPRRHLLTTGWSAFVNKKKLVPGDAVLFLRGSDGELRLGIRRASLVKSDGNSCSQLFNASCIVALVNAISMQKTFTLSYNPSKFCRVRSFDIIVPYHKFCKSLAHRFSSGMRFKIRSEREDSSERSGLIIGVNNVDSGRWPNSKWKCLLVRWDDMEAHCISRVSPWEIEPCALLPGSSSAAVPGTKRSRDGFLATNPDFQAPRDESEIPDFGGPSRFQKVLQGQEVFRFAPPYPKPQLPSHHPSTITPIPCLNGSTIRPLGNNIRYSGHTSFKTSLLAEPFRLPKVLKSQPNLAILPHKRCPFMINGLIEVPNHRLTSSSPTQNHNQGPFHASQRKSTSSDPINEDRFHENAQAKDSEDEQRSHTGFANVLNTKPLFIDKHNFVAVCNKTCRLFGFPIGGEGITAAATTSNKGRNNPAGSQPTYNQPFP